MALFPPRQRTLFAFRLLRASDLSLLHRWFNMPHIKQFYSLKNWSFTEINANFSPYFSLTAPIQGFIVSYKQTIIGYAQFYSLPKAAHMSFTLNQLNNKKSACLDFFIGETEYLHKGLAIPLLKAFIGKKLWPDFDHCLADPLIDNAIAIHCLKKAGFRKLKTTLTLNDQQEPIVRQLMLLNKNFPTRKINL